MAQKGGVGQLDSRVLIFTMPDSTTTAHAAMQAGAAGYVVRSCADRDLLKAVDVVLNGGVAFFTS